MSCPECGSIRTVPCSGYDDDDYTVWGDCCTDCGWSNLYDNEEDD